eukprot:3428241-Pyramimonas_sp.AAC.2
MRYHSGMSEYHWNRLCYDVNLQPAHKGQNATHHVCSHNIRMPTISSIVACPTTMYKLHLLHRLGQVAAKGFSTCDHLDVTLLWKFRVELLSSFLERL